jgi:hypothetical protein
MKAIHKFVVRPRVLMPVNAKIISVQAQGDAICIWAEVDTLADKVERLFFSLGTGQPMPDVKCDYLATVQVGEYVWHVYEER